MPLVMKAMGERTGPVVVCDCCGQRIEDAREGSCVWVGRDSDSDPGATTNFVHNGDCFIAFERSRPRGQYLCSNGLHLILFFLQNNTKFDLKSTKNEVRFTERYM